MSYRLLPQPEMDSLDTLLRESVLKDTLRFWELNRLRGVSASMAAEGNISATILKALDEMVEKVRAHEQP